ncbi:MAG: hypothetical protein K2X06_16770 [Burkholderiales bacterium]|nr:hypothetical protein [Burkholderiales bacterium]
MTGFLRLALHAKWLRGALIVLLLGAQHGALTHALTHAGWLAQDKVAVHASLQAEHHPAEHAVELCAFDLVYSQVLGGVHGGHDMAFAAAGHVPAVAAVLAVRNPVTVIPYDPRGPPAIS